ncbi:type I-E CRISPR-associated protein Cas5/CasD [Lactiplantibacillus mudanjiangensis]|uniref:Type I-E CRISPR-associated protein Cas5/CasD [Lactobacillus sp.] n=1 Tax=Lactiplantibacillus mudanjiangensis TaxID=1296538 RepID=A0A660E1Q7_9LACO|nr:type I-E CRISPR-associated protein Cas5/CasD [Lactiplantibacillus mudanjiangensis]VDG22730.1 type I-E CRISPR-associated protein Cas5/CasD [Lactobacillus sp.] [Lactiplantibacillus mudanjiangensis]VDG26733.1 type I-E CRISPR-associated protein Cas5/CasD [Lactobacillus sp.] [Lactiplantibacillus mudanjiangensis]
MKILTIKLAAPLQSYGNEATFERRTTAHYPTKSAVIGMIAAALGYRRTDPRITTLNDLSFAVRIDQAGTVLTDYQTVEWKKNTRKITYREYLQDAKFMVALGSEDAQFIEQIKLALTHPKFPLFLGRRSNAPAGVLQVELFDETSPVAILKKMTWQAANWYQRKGHRATIEIIADADLIPDKTSALVKDRVQSFDQRNRRYSFRAIARTNVNLVDLDQQAQAAGTQHDAMYYLD